MDTTETETKQRRSWCPWPKCRQCSAPFLKNAAHHVYCSGVCRQQAYRDKNARRGMCLGCGQAVKNRLYCGSSCGARFRRWVRDGRPMKCPNPQCPRHGVSMAHVWDETAEGWLCNGCGQIQWW
jgi:hypothetical protein